MDGSSILLPNQIAVYTLANDNAEKKLDATSTDAQFKRWWWRVLVMWPWGRVHFNAFVWVCNDSVQSASVHACCKSMHVCVLVFKVIVLSKYVWNYITFFSRLNLPVNLCPYQLKTQLLVLFQVNCAAAYEQWEHNCSVYRKFPSKAPFYRH